MCYFLVELSRVEFIGVLRHMQRYFSQICDGTDVQADWRNCTYGRAPNAIDISQGSLTCLSWHGTTLFIRWFRHTAPYSRLLRHAGDTEDVFSTNNPVSSRGKTLEEKYQQRGYYMPNTLNKIAAALKHHISHSGRFIIFFDDQCSDKMRPRGKPGVKMRKRPPYPHARSKRRLKWCGFLE